MHATGNPLNGLVAVALEQKDSTGVDRIVMTTLTGNDGTCVFCPIPSGTYDVVIVGDRNDGTAYGPSIITGVSKGQTIGTVNLYTSAVDSSGAVQFSGVVTSQNSTNQGTIIDVQASALETAPLGGTTFTIPLLPNAQQPAATLALETAASSGCPTGTDCVSYSMMLPAGGAYIGSYSATGPSLSQSSLLATYVIDGLAFVPSSGGIADCVPPEQKTAATALTAGGNFNITGQLLPFTQCQ